MKATHFRAQLFQVIDAVLDDGKPIEIELSGRVVELRPKALPPGSKLARLVTRPNVVAAADEELGAFGWGCAEWQQEWEAQWDLWLGNLWLGDSRLGDSRLGDSRLEDHSLETPTAAGKLVRQPVRAAAFRHARATAEYILAGSGLAAGELAHGRTRTQGATKAPASREAKRATAETAKVRKSAKSRLRKGA